MRQWFDERDERIQGEFIGIIQNLERKNRATLNENIFKALERRHSGKCDGLHEILIDTDKGHHYRVIGVLEENTFTMLYPFFKNEQPRYKVPCDESNKRRLEIASDRQRAKDCNFLAPDAD
jgi:hypothetical protein